MALQAALKTDATPAPMPTHFYNEFDSFMSRPAPKFSSAVSDGSKKNSVSKKKGGEGDVVLPRVGPGPGIAVAGVEKKKNSSVSSKIKSKISASRAVASTAQRPFDPALLQEAFAYADQLQQDTALYTNGDDEGEECSHQARESRGMPTKSGSAPQLSKPKQSSNNVSHLNPYERQQLARGEKKQTSSKKASSGKSSKQSKEGIVKRLRSKTSTEAPDDKAFSNISAGGLEHTRNKGGGTDYASLVENFENGTTLLKLKAELAASRQSMADSENFMRQLSKEYSSKKRR